MAKVMEQHQAVAMVVMVVIEVLLWSWDGLGGDEAATSVPHMPTCFLSMWH